MPYTSKKEKKKNKKGRERVRDGVPSLDRRVRNGDEREEEEEGL